MSSKDVSIRADPAPGMGKWNRSKRRALLSEKKASSSVVSKRKITKTERREKYTAIAKERQMRNQQKDLTCFQCRQKGHTIQFCPEANLDDSHTKTQPVALKSAKSRKLSSAKPIISVCCYKCGSMEHSLAKCPKRVTGKSEKEDSELPFATCFICQQKGHLSSQCSQNEHGIYVNGGQCKHCSSIYHRASDCPNKKVRTSDKNNLDADGKIGNFDFSELLEEDTTDASTELMKTKQDRDANTTKKKRVVNF